MPTSAFYDAGKLRQIATNLFYGWGYNFYRIENQLRADDQLVRSKAGWLLGQAAASVREAESGYRREFLPPPSREKPFPDAAAVTAAQQLERLGGGLSALALFIQQQPVPANDRMSQRYRLEAQTLSALNAIDEELVGQCELMRSMVEAKDGASILAEFSGLNDGIEAIKSTLHRREAVLLDRAP